MTDFENRLVFCDLAEQPATLEKIVSLLLHEWGEAERWSDPETVRRRYEARARHELGEATYIARMGDVLCGFASLTFRELPRHPSMDWWIGEVVVDPSMRRQGIGKQLFQTLITAAKSKHIRDLYLYTPDKEDLYRRWGWRTIAHDIANEEPVCIMTRSTE